MRNFLDNAREALVDAAMGAGCGLALGVSSVLAIASLYLVFGRK